MDCLEFRRRLAAEPRARESAFVAHRDSCHAGCTEAWWRAQRLERRIEAALTIEPPAGLTERILLTQATGMRVRTRRWQVGLALAASLLLAVGVGTFGWNRSAQADPLPAMSVAHMRDESFALARTQPVSEGALRRDFAARGVDLHAMPQGAVFVRDCDVGPYRTVHMVFRINNEPVTALYFVGRNTTHSRDFHHAGWQGRELPLDHGTLLLLGADARGFAEVERTLRDAVERVGAVGA
ncbi:MAG TPA: DUF3379 family protein [Rhodanobacteraceae bacterium]|nr:DUF3379 family protein [Rhodanobacteraceae bacterium]